VSRQRAAQPVLLLLLVLVAFFTPQTARPTAPATTLSAASGHHASTAPATRGGIEHHQSTEPLLRAAPAGGNLPVPSTAARNDRVTTPTLLLVQRPRPPTQRVLSAVPLAPTGRSPPAPAGT
jgi:hypothetical protein